MAKQVDLNSRFFRDKFGLELNARVFLPSAFAILLFVILGVVFSAELNDGLEAIQTFISETAGWFYILVVNLVLLFAFYLMFSRFGRIRLGGPEARPEFSTLAWLAMLFSAGMGIGLVFWSVAEPVMHFASPPSGEPESIEAARQAMRITFYHWGFHPWGVYAIVALGLAFFSYNRGLPLTIRSVFYPLLGKRIHGRWGDVIDTVAVVATLFGVATSLGFGVKQISTGMDFVFGFGNTGGWQIALIAIITLIATVSVVMGLDGGIRRLSEINLYVAGFLLAMIFLLGPTIFLLRAFVQNTGEYISSLPRMSTWTEAYSAAGWQNAWTVFYWGWWIAWAPFVGMFIAQISRGRTIREFLVGVLFAPTILTFVWLTVFGDTAINLELENKAEIIPQVMADEAVALFQLLQNFPVSMLTSILAIVVVVLFFVTSSDSGSLVIDVIAAGGHSDPPVQQRIFWAVLEGLVAGVLLVGGGLAALQTAAITTGLPFAIIIGIMCFGLYKGLDEGLEEEVEAGEKATHTKSPPGAVHDLNIPQHGRNWVVLEWNPPEDGGKVAAYRIRRRRAESDQWNDVAMTLEESAALHHTERPGAYVFQIVPVNRAGEGPPSEEYEVRFAMPKRHGARHTIERQ